MVNTSVRSRRKNMGEGWLKIYRKLTEWEWYNHSEMVHLFIHLLIKASPTDKTWQGRVVKRGQVVISRPKISAETGISERTIRTCLARLVASGEIVIETTNRFSIVTICKYGDYQQVEKQNDQPNDQPSDQQSDQPNDHIIRNKEVKNNNISPAPPEGDAGAGTSSKKSAKKKKPEEYTIVTKGRKVYEDFFKELFEVDYVWSSKDGGVMKAILNKITSSRRARNMAIDDDSVVGAFSALLQSITDDWILKNLSLDLIVNKYNTIVAQAKANKTKGNGARQKAGTRSDGEGVLAGQSAAVINDIAKADEYYYNGGE